ncbi:MAG: hypothetical protein MJZ36_01370 [Bacteroidaceae bacterium]|nr:hypothetical protein [Bacteroidaceae bacterium]
MKRPKTFSDRALFAAREEVLESHLDEVCDYLAQKSRDPDMIVELMHVVSIISINFYKSTKTPKSRKQWK